MKRKQAKALGYPPGADPGRWVRCSSCREQIPCDVRGNQYPHTCKR